MQSLIEPLLPPELINTKQVDRELLIVGDSTAEFEILINADTRLYGVFIIVNPTSLNAEVDIGLNYMALINNYEYASGDWGKLHYMGPYNALMNIPHPNIGYIPVQGITNCKFRLRLTDISNAVLSISLKLLLSKAPTKRCIHRSKSTVNLFSRDDIDDLSVTEEPRRRSYTI